VFSNHRKLNFRLIRVVDLQQNLQQACTFRLLFGFGYASISIISLLLSTINDLHTTTYKHLIGTENPCVAGSTPALPISIPPCKWLLFCAKSCVSNILRFAVNCCVFRSELPAKDSHCLLPKEFFTSFLQLLSSVPNSII
jgi:hypothetical protein